MRDRSDKIKPALARLMKEHIAHITDVEAKVVSTFPSDELSIGVQVGVIGLDEVRYFTVTLKEMRDYEQPL